MNPTVYFPVKIPQVNALDEEEDGRPRFITEAIFSVYINNKLFQIPVGVKFDYASIPRVFWSILIPNDPEYQAASLLHDTLYQAEVFKRSFNDKLFLAAMVSTGVPKWKRNLMYIAVRMGGGFTYKKHLIPNIEILRQKLGIVSNTRPALNNW
jgi:hypothetical protein